MGRSRPWPPHCRPRVSPRCQPVAARSGHIVARRSVRTWATKVRPGSALVDPQAIDATIQAFGYEPSASWWLPARGLGSRVRSPPDDPRLRTPEPIEPVGEQHVTVEDGDPCGRGDVEVGTRGELQRDQLAGAEQNGQDRALPDAAEGEPRLSDRDLDGPQDPERCPASHQLPPARGRRSRGIRP